MRKDKIEKNGVVSNTLALAREYMRTNVVTVMLILATFFCALILLFIQNVEFAQGQSSVNFHGFLSSVVYHVLLCILVFFFCSKSYFPSGFEIKETATESILYLITFATVVFGIKYAGFNASVNIVILIPAAFCAFLVAIIFSQMSAVFFSILISLSVLNATGYELFPFLYTLASSLMATRIVRTVRTRSTMVLAAIVQAFANILFFELLNISFGKSIGESLYILPGLAFNGFISAILCLGMLTPLELILNTASPFRLLELSDMNSPVLKRLFSTASGTYTHSIAVAQLAENACREINANALLARVASYYHDIGKMDNPEYFTENQGGEENLHDNLNPSLSVSIIRSHVRKGIEKAHELRLPQPIVDIISEHHGNQVISFFYNEAKQKDPTVNPEDYSYNGRPPSTKESAVVLLADTVEAACRSLQNKSVPSIEKFVDTLVKAKIESGQLDNSTLTFKEIYLIKKAFVQFLAGYYHSRIKYPDQKEPEAQKKSDDSLPKEVQNAKNGEESSVEKNFEEQKNKDFQDEKNSSEEKNKKIKTASKTAVKKNEAKTASKTSGAKTAAKTSSSKTAVKGATKTSVKSATKTSVKSATKTAVKVTAKKNKKTSSSKGASDGK